MTIRSAFVIAWIESDVGSTLSVIFGVFKYEFPLIANQWFSHFPFFCDGESTWEHSLWPRLNASALHTCCKLREDKFLFRFHTNMTVTTFRGGSFRNYVIAWRAVAPSATPVIFVVTWHLEIGKFWFDCRFVALHPCSKDFHMSVCIHKQISVLRFLLQKVPRVL